METGYSLRRYYWRSVRGMNSSQPLFMQPTSASGQIPTLTDCPDSSHPQSANSISDFLLETGLNQHVCPDKINASSAVEHWKSHTVRRPSWPWLSNFFAHARLELMLVLLK